MIKYHKYQVRLVKYALGKGIIFDANKLRAVDCSVRLPFAQYCYPDFHKQSGIYVLYTSP